MARTTTIALAGTLGLLLAGCSGTGGAGSGMPNAPAASAPDSIQNAAPATPDGSSPGAGGAVGALTALSGPIKTFNDENANEPTSDPKGKGTGTCHNGREFYAPDRKGDPNSTERLDFYDSACTQLARDAVRLWTSTGTNSETVNRTVDNYRYGNSNPSSVRLETTQFSSATFGNYGFPIVAGGYDRETASTLEIGNDKKNIIADTETVMQPSSTNVNDYCTDSAGYNSVGVHRLMMTFGWQGGAYGGSTPNTRTVNPDGSVTWSSTHTGTSEEAPIGGFAIATGALNTACPIVTPAYTLTGGTSKGNYTIPIVVTYREGVITDLTVTNATLADGNTLNVTTNANLPPSSQNFIQGTIANGSTQIATFDVTAYGNGTLTVDKNNRDFTITDWNVVR